MATLRSFTCRLCLLLLAPACGGDDPADASTGASTGESTGSTAAASTSTGDTTDEPTGAAADGSTSTGMVEDESTSTGDTTIEPATATDTDTTEGPMPGPCDDLIAPDPANMYVDWVELFHNLETNEHSLTANRVEGDDSWRVTFWDLGPDPVPGVHAMHPILGEELLGNAAGSSIEGTATLELVTVTPECVTGRISELVLADGVMPYWVDVELTGGFVATRRAL